jgi:hypothetical protein
MPWQIPNYDSLHILVSEEDQVDDDWDWDPNKVELDVDELEQALGSRKG